jgi:hypothetical protein
MAIGTRKRRAAQEGLWYRSEIAEAPGPFTRNRERFSPDGEV